MALVAVVTLLLVAVSGAALFRAQRDLNAVQNRQQDQIVPARLDVARLLSLMVDQETGERGYVLTGQTRYLDPYTRGQAEIGPLLNEIASLTAGVPGMAERIVTIRTAQAAWTTSAAEPEIAAVRAGERTKAEQLVASGRGKTLFDALRADHASAEARVAAYESETAAQAADLSDRLSILLTATLALLALLAVLTTVAMERSVLRPLNRIGARVRSVSAGDLDEVVEGDGPREFRELARDVDTMRRRMLDEIDTTRQATEALALREPTVAALQAALAPTLSSVPGVEIAARLVPAEGVLAGDFVDTVVLPDGTLGFVLGDVAGHGPVPAIFGLRLKLLRGSLLASGLEPGEVFSAALARLDDVTDETFATVVVAVVDQRRGEVRYANAGHPAPLLLSEDARGLATHLDLDATGPFLSPLFPQATWETRSAPFGASDLLLAYTDGVIEARDPDGHELGLQRTVDTLVDRPPSDRLETLLDVLYGEIRDHAAELKDDTTLVLCRHSGGSLPLSEDDAPANR